MHSDELHDYIKTTSLIKHIYHNTREINTRKNKKKGLRGKLIIEYEMFDVMKENSMKRER